MVYRFVHSADIHLDSPLRSLALCDPALAELIGNATRRAFVTLVDLCLSEQVDALLLAGDLYDGEQTSMKTARFLAEQIRRLDEAGIRVFIIRGNHDAMSKITKELTLPESVTIFGSRAEAISIEDADGGIPIAIHGLSFAKPHAPDSLLPRYKPPIEGAVNIGMMHTSLAGVSGHDLYAPCSIADLQASGFRYWALGHIHKRSVADGDCHVVMPGMVQGRDINEAGAKSATLVTVADDRSIRIEEHTTSVAQFERIDVDVTGVDEWPELIATIAQAMAKERENAICSHLVGRLRLSGGTRLAWRIRRDLDLLTEEARDRASVVGKCWVEKVEVDCSGPGRSTGAAADPLSELRALIDNDVIGSASFQEEVEQIAVELRSQLPQECRAILGLDEAAEKAAIAALVSEGADDVIARLQALDLGGERIMRLNSLDITRYGKFTDHVIDFGQPAEGQPDLHIIYGPNEAGKSTAFAAFLDLLFGIEARSRFNFIHPYSAMRIGAVLDTSDGAHELARIKRPQRSLLDGNDRPIAESLIQNELGGLDREAYRMMFSLDDDTLEAGGESILASKGDLGQLLFAASTGLADLSRALVDLKVEADGFYKYRARSGELHELKTELATLKADREKIDTFAAEYAQLVKVRDRAKAQYDDAITERGRTQARIEDIQRCLSAMPRLAAFRSVRDKLGQFSELPEAPDGWLNDLPTLQTQSIELTTRLKETEAEIARITAELEAIDTDKTALRHADRIDALSELRARHVAAENDLPERRLQRQELELKISGILGRLGKPDEAEPANLVLDASAVGHLRELIETRSGVEASVKAAQRELEEARERFDEVQSRQQETVCVTGDAEEERAPRIAALTEIVGRLRGGDHLSRLRLAERSCQTSRETLAQRMAELRPWAGSDDQLAGLNVPLPGDIERWKETLAEANRLIDRHEAEIDRLEAERRRVQARLDTISSVDGVVSEGDAAKVRAEREEAWANHRREMNETSATAFEAVLRRDDIVVNARLRHEAEIAKLHEASATLAALKADLETSGERLKTALASRQTVHDELAAFLLSMTPGLPNSFALAQLETWLARREVALEARAGLKRAEHDLKEASADISAAREALSGALNALSLTHDPETDLESLLVLAQSAVDREARFRSLREDLRARDGEVKARERELKKASEADEAWRESWGGACSACWLSDGGAAPSVAAVREILAALAELGPSVESRSSLADRIRKMEDEAVRFQGEVAAIAQLLQLEAQSSDAMSLSHQMAERLQQARAAQSTKAAVAQALKKAKARQRDLTADREIHDRRTEEMTAFFQVASLAEVAVKLQDIARRTELTKQLGEAERDILETLGLPSIEAAETALDATDRATLESELAGFKGRFGDQDERTRELFSNFRKAVDQIEAVGGDGAAANIEEKRQTTLLQIEEKARRYMRLRVGILAAGHALHLYRDKHRSSMMARASSAFRAISREAYTKLTTQLEKDGEILIAVSADGSSKVASELSKGTRFQLYLALRVAGYYEFAQSRPLVPFIADDIMETFDEFRAEETFRVFAEMAQVGQVIYLTHHRHLCEIAQSICPDVRVHDLTSPSIRKQSMVSVA